MSRIQATFEQLAKNRRKALIPFVTAGDPEPGMTVPLMHALVEAGADVIELGVPFSDPMADGPVIQRASDRALKHGVGLDRVLALVREFRAGNQATPVVLMGYANPIEAMGTGRFVNEAQQAGVDGVLVVDYPPEECESFAGLGAQPRHGPDFSARADLQRCAHGPGGQARQRLPVLRFAQGRHRCRAPGSGRGGRENSPDPPPDHAAGRRGIRHPRCGHGQGRGAVCRCRGHRQRHYPANGSGPRGRAGAARGQVHAGHSGGAGRK